jgi:Mg-chelatase subunit ChlD
MGSDLLDCTNIEPITKWDLLSTSNIDRILEELSYTRTKDLKKIVSNIQREDTEFSHRIEEYRKIIKKEIDTRLNIIDTRYENEKKALEEQYSNTLNKYRKQKEKLESFYENVNLADLSSILGQQEVLSFILPEKQEKRHLSIWTKIKLFLISLFNKIINLFKLKKNQKKSKNKDIFILKQIGMRYDDMFSIAISDNSFGNEVLSKIAEENNIPKLQLEKERKIKSSQYKKLVDNYLKNRLNEIDPREVNIKVKKKIKKEVAKFKDREKKVNDEKKEKIEEKEKEKKLEKEKVLEQEKNKEPEKIVSKIVSEMEERGFIKPSQETFSVTSAFIDRLSKIIFEEEMRKLYENYKITPSYASIQTGVYERRKLKKGEEANKLDVVNSLIESRMYLEKNIEEDHSYIYYEIGEQERHVVLAFDKSGSMDENNKLYAAKRALTALYVAIKKHDPKTVIDIIAFDSKIKIMDFYTMWEAEAGEFTNTGEALFAAYKLLGNKKTTKKEVYLITDGLPEAYTTNSGKIKAGDLNKSMEYALAAAKVIGKSKDIKVTIILLKSTDSRYEKAAKEIANQCNGKLIITEPNSLAITLLKENYGFN